MGYSGIFPLPEVWRKKGEGGVILFEFPSTEMKVVVFKLNKEYIRVYLCDDLYLSAVILISQPDKSV